MKVSRSLLIVCAVWTLSAGGCSDDSFSGVKRIPPDIQAILDKPLYDQAIWGLRVVDLDSGQALLDLRPGHPFLIGSVRKLFSVGLLLNQIGADHRFETPVFRQGTVTGGVLDGDLVLVASGDLTMGGRSNPNGTIAISGFDHNEANDLGNAVLTAPDPIAGYRSLAQQVAASGIERIAGDVIIDDRLFVPFFFREQFDVRPIFINDDVVDVVMDPTTPGALAAVTWRPVSEAFRVDSSLTTGAAGSQFDLDREPPLPPCIGQPDCVGTISGVLPVDFVPPLTNAFPLVRNFRIVQPANYARTVLIEELERAGVAVDANPVAPNPVEKLPPSSAYQDANRVAQLISFPYGDYARYILKVSYNIGADTSLVLFGLAKGVNSIDDALVVERDTLRDQYGIPSDEIFFIDGSGGGETTATNEAVTKILEDMSRAPVAEEFRDAQPLLGVDGSLGFVTDFEADPTLAGARGQVAAKTGTFVGGTDESPSLRAQALGGYIATRSGRRLAFQLVVNDVGVLSDFDVVLQVFQDEGTIAAILWRDY